jgi:hypothetical protein
MDVHDEGYSRVLVTNYACNASEALARATRRVLRLLLVPGAVLPL